MTISGADAGNDSLVVNGVAGNDTIDASGLHAGQVNLTLNGGDGNDTIIGSAGNDIVIGGRGNDVASLGAGDDTFVWNPGDGSDTVEGGAGNDTLLFNGANVNENIDISANGSRAMFTRDVGDVTMDLNSVETIDVNALGGADTITVNDLSGTDVKQVAIDLSAPPGSGVGDGQADTVVINATNGDDVINAHRQQRRGHGVGSGYRRDDHRLRCERSHRHQRSRRRRRHRGVRASERRCSSPPMAATATTS